MSEPQQFLVTLPADQATQDDIRLVVQALVENEVAAEVSVESLDLGVLTPEEQSLPLIIQIMQAQYAAMADTMNRQVELAKASENSAWRAAADIVEAVILQQRKFAEIGLNVKVPEVEAALAKANVAGLARASYLQAIDE